MKLLFHSVDQQRAHLEPVIRRWHPAFRTGGFVFAELLERALAADQTVLDAGCGRGGLITTFREKIKTLIGVDRDQASLDNNSVLDRALRSDLSSIPLPDRSIDLITSEFVIEHLENPAAVFGEFFRLLRPGGRFIFLTSNSLNPVMRLSRYTPHRFHRWYRQKILHNTEASFPTFYRANTPHRLHRALLAAGLKKEKLILAGNPEYLAISPLLGIPAVLVERLIDRPALEWMKMYLIGQYARP